MMAGISSAIKRLLRGGALLCVTGALFAASCAKDDGSGSGGDKDPICDVDITSNDSVMAGLSATCAPCHGVGTNKPFFASLAAFESLLVYDTQYVVKGDPDGSELVRLLEGTGTNTFKQMPTAGATFKERAEAGDTSLTMAQVREWIDNLPEPEAQNFEARNAPTVRRMTAEHLVAQLYEPLGLSEDDFFNQNFTSTDGQALPARSPDDLTVRYDYTNNQHQVYPRFMALGGPHWLDRRLRSRDLSPTLLQAITQISQARCRKAVEKPNNSALFRFANVGDSSDTKASEIRDNIRYLHLRILGEVASEQDVDDLYSGVFLHYEPAGSVTAWTATCAVLVRHPLAMSY